MIQKIREEIERRLKDYWEICFHDVVAFNEDSNVRELKELLAFIRTLEESEKPINPVDFDKAWEEYGKSKGGGAITVNVKDLARHFYELGRGHSEIPNDLEEAADEYEKANTGIYPEVGQTSIRDAFIDGAKWQKEQDDKGLSEKIAAAYQLGVRDKEKKFVENRLAPPIDFPTTDEEVTKFLAETPPVEVPEKYKTPDWLFKAMTEERHTLREWMILFQKHPELREEFDRMVKPKEIE